MRSTRERKCEVEDEREMEFDRVYIVEVKARRSRCCFFFKN